MGALHVFRAGPDLPARWSPTLPFHRGGNKQVILSSGERWHLPRGKSYRDIPGEDRLGDELQAAVKEVAAKWSHAELSPDERAAIDRMLKAGKEYRANLLERQARGRWVEIQMQARFPGLSWNSRGVDITGPGGQSYHYEFLSELRALLGELDAADFHPSCIHGTVVVLEVPLLELERRALRPPGPKI